jgi:hypothetical protein
VCYGAPSDRMSCPIQWQPARGRTARLPCSPAGCSLPGRRFDPGVPTRVFLGVIQIVAEQSMPSAVCFNQWCVCSAIATQGCYLMSDVQRVQVVIIPGAIPTVLQGGVHDLP